MVSRQMKLCLAYAALSALLAYYIYAFMPHDRELKSLGILLFKLLPFLLAALAISTFDARLTKLPSIGIGLLSVGFLMLFGLFVPRIFWEGFENESKGLYYIVLIMVPFMILLIGFAFRLGGGSSETTLRLLLVLLVLMLSGIEDLAYLVTTPREGGIPDVWDWASHVKVRIGHYPTKYEAYAFIAAHFIAAVAIATYSFRPLKKLELLLGN